jgi:dTDP-glucose 4,6-dehydratase
MSRTLIVTGGAGFIGSNFVLALRASRPDWRIVNLDALTYAGNLENLAGVEDDPGYVFVQGDITRREDVDKAFDAAAELGGPISVVHFAAESHVDRSSQSGLPFVVTNVLGTQVLVDASRARGVERFVHVSTDEVYGSLGATGYFTEDTPLAPNSPYSASKAASDLLVRAAVHTFGFPGLITRCSNNYGPYQFPEKLIPLMISNASAGKPLPVYGDGMNVRDWLYVVDHCEAILAVLEKGRTGEVYNIGGRNEHPNLEIVRRILAALGRPESLITYVKDRPGHDRRYAIDASKIERELGWRPRFRFEEALPLTVAWYRDHATWLQRVTSGAYRDYYARQYGG